MSEKDIDHYSFNTHDVLGIGSFGTVFQGIDKNNNRIVAFKMIDKDNLLNDPKAQRGFMSEIKIMQKLNHKNIVQLIDVLETQNNYYIVQELCENGDLSKYLKKNRFVDEKLALTIILDVLRGFQELLKYGIIHRDLKPANILIHNNTYKIADFGFAKIVGNYNPNVLYSQVGTPLYMSPQILKNESYSTKCDIWSLGFLFYEILYGKSPWMASSIPQLVKNIHTQPLVFHDQINQVSNDVKNFIAKCLVIQENNRLGWQEVFLHPVFASYFVQAPKVEKLFDEKEMSLAMSMREQFESQQFSIQELVKTLAEDEDRILNIETFRQTFLAINENFQVEDILSIFNEIDEKQIGQITCKNVLDWFVNMEYKINICNKIELEDSLIISDSIYGIPQQQQTQQGLNQIQINENMQLIQILYDEIKTKNLNLVEFFQKFSTTPNQMNYDDFQIMMLNFDATLGLEEILAAFKLFAFDKNDKITLNQFKHVLEQNLQNEYL